MRPAFHPSVSRSPDIPERAGGALEALRAPSRTQTYRLQTTEEAVNRDLEIRIVELAEGLIQELSIAEKETRTWRVLRGFSPDESKKVTMILAGTKSGSISSRDMDRVLRKLDKFCRGCRQVAHKDAYSRIEAFIRGSGVPPERTIPENLQEQVAHRTLLRSAERLFNNLHLFPAVLPEVCRMLCERDASYAAKLCLSVGTGVQGLGSFTNIDTNVAVSLVQSLCSSSTGFRGADRAVPLRHLAARLHFFGKGADGELLDRLCKAVLTDNLDPTIVVRALSTGSSAPDSPLCGPGHNRRNKARFILQNLDLVQPRFRQPIIERLLVRLSPDLIGAVPREVCRGLDQKGLARFLIAYAPLNPNPADEKSADVILENYMEGVPEPTPAAGMRALASNLSLFQGLPKQFARELFAHNYSAQVRDNLGAFTGLPLEFARRLIDRDSQSCECVARSLHAFEWDRAGALQMMKTIQAKRQTQVVLSSFDTLPPEFLNAVESEYFLQDYRSEIGIMSEKIYEEYRALRRDGELVKARALGHRIKDVVDELITGRPFDPALRSFPYLPELLGSIFPQHSNFRVLSIKPRSYDRSADLARFKIRAVYKMDLAGGVKMVLRPGARPGSQEHEALEKGIKDVQERLSKTSFDPKAMREELGEMLRTVEQKVSRDGRAMNLSSVEDRLHRLLLETLAGRSPKQEVKKLLLAYHFAVCEDIRGYMSGTRSLSEQSKSPAYAHLLHEREFFADRVRDSAVEIVRSAAPALRQIWPNYSSLINQEVLSQERADRLNRARADQVGITDTFARAISDTLTKPGVPREKRYLAVSRMIESEQRRLARVWEKLTGKQIEPSEINLRQAPQIFAAAPAPIFSSGTYEEPAFAAYLSGAVANLFQNEVDVIDRELANYKREEGGPAAHQALLGYISKNPFSFIARAVAGVCVAKDEAQWALPNYLQMVLHDAVSKRCEGLILLHAFEDQGKTILTASFQPCSTFLYKVDEPTLFNELLSRVVEFAQDNDFDLVACSCNHTIRTNRTGGPFETAIDARISRIKKKFALSSEQIFSFNPSYKLRDLDVLWEKAG